MTTFDQEQRTRKRAHGMSLEELEELKAKQQANQVEFVPCNQNADYTIAKHESLHFYLVKEESPLYDQQTGKKRSTPKYVRYSIQKWDEMKKFNAFVNREVEILHDPEREADIQKVASKKPVTKKVEREKNEAHTRIKKIED